MLNYVPRICYSSDLKHFCVCIVNGFSRLRPACHVLDLTNSVQQTLFVHVLIQGHVQAQLGAVRHDPHSDIVRANREGVDQRAQEIELRSKVVFV